MMLIIAWAKIAVYFRKPLHSDIIHYHARTARIPSVYAGIIRHSAEAVAVVTHR